MSDPQADRPTAPAGSALPARVRVRRAPRFRVFIGIGVVLGLLTALILTSVFPVDEKVGFAGTFGYLALYGVVIGLVLGALVAIVLDAILSRRAREVTAEVEIVESPEPDPAVKETSVERTSAETSTDETSTDETSTEDEDEERE